MWVSPPNMLSLKLWHSYNSTNWVHTLALRLQNFTTKRHSRVNYCLKRICVSLEDVSSIPRPSSPKKSYTEWKKWKKMRNILSAQKVEWEQFVFHGFDKRVWFTIWRLLSTMTNVGRRLKGTMWVQQWKWARWIIRLLIIPHLQYSDKNNYCFIGM